MEYLVTAGKTGEISLTEKDTITEIIQNVRMIISTMRGSVPLYRDFGISPRWVDRPTPVVKALMISDIRESVEKWEPRVNVTQVTFNEDPSDPTHLIPSVHISIRRIEADA